MIKRITTLCALVLAAFCFAGTAVAANDAGQQDMQKLMTAYSKDAKQLKQIHEKAIDNNPDLVKQQEKFESQVHDAIEKQGYDIDAGQERMQSMAEKLQSRDLSDNERQEVMQKFQNEREQLIKARSAALSQPDIKKSGEELQDATITAMTKENPKTKDLISDMEDKRDQLQKASQSQQQSQQPQLQQNSQ